MFVFYCLCMIYCHWSSNFQRERFWTPINHFNPSPPSVFVPIPSAGFTYRLDRLKHRASTFRGPAANALISKQPYSIFPYTVTIHFRILQIFKHPSSSSPLLELIKHIFIFLQSWRCGIGRGFISGIAYGLSLSKSGTEVTHECYWLQGYQVVLNVIVCY